MALWDLRGKIAGLPVHRLLGGPLRTSARAYATGLYRRAEDPERNREILLAEALDYVAQGFSAMKLKVGFDPSDDATNVRAIRAVIGEDVAPMIDANHGFDRLDALALADRVADLGVGWFEEPVAPEDVDGYRWLKARTRIPLAGGECAFTRFDFQKLIAAAALDVVQPDACAAGEITECWRIAPLTSAAGLRYHPHVWGTGIAVATALQLIAVLPGAASGLFANEPWLQFDRSPHPFGDAVLTNPFRLDAGRVAVPTDPGLGVTIDREALLRFRVGPETRLRSRAERHRPPRRRRPRKGIGAHAPCRAEEVVSQHAKRKPTLREIFASRYGDAPGEVVETTATALHGMAARASCRRFTSDPVPEALVETLAAVALAAPTKSDLQQRDLVLVRDPGQRARLAALVAEQAWIAEAPALVVVLANNRRQRRLHLLRGHAFANDHLDALVNAIGDAAIALQAFVTAAETVGLGCCPISAVRNRPAEIGALLALPGHVVPFAGLALGWPALPAKPSLRLPLRTTVHVDRYDEGDLDAALTAYDTRRRELQAFGTQRRPDLFGTSSTYGWAEDKARQYALPERQDFGAFVRAKGFVLE